MKRLIVAALVLAGLVGLHPRRAFATQLVFELRHTPLLERPNHTPSLCPMLALTVSQHWWIGAGYELVQDYDAVLWKSSMEGHKPLIMSGLRAGTWYRGGDDRQGLTYSVGGILTFANPAFSLFRSPTGIDSGTSIVDFGADFTLGRIWDTFIFEFYVTPAWSYGQVASTAAQRTDSYSAFTYRFGGALVFMFNL
jgi:hypothetical protein